MSPDRFSPSRSGASLAAAVLVSTLLPLAVVVPEAAGQDADHLLLSEVVVTANRQGSPFIEVVNPTGADADLSTVYLSTAHDTQLGQLYWNVVLGEDAGGGTSGNVHARFPAGMSLAAGDTLVIAIAGSEEFAAEYGHLPDLELFEDGLAPDQVPEMVEVFGGSIGAGLGSGGGNTPALSEFSESIVLYRWDGSSDSVADVDYLIYGDSERYRVDKSGVTVGAHTYADDTPVGAQSSAGPAPGDGRALRRVAAAETGEPQTGGNGVTGHDETGEDLAASWELVLDQQPAAAPDSWHAPAPIVLSASSGGALEDAPINVQAEVVAFDAITAVTVHYRLDGGAWQTLALDPQTGDIFAGQLPGQPADTVIEWYLTATGAGGGEATWPVQGAAAPRSLTVIAGGEGDAVKLLISEVSVIASAQEYVEIVNPGLTDADLSDYYLSDAIYAPGDQFYWRIAEGNPSQQTVGGGDFSDFHARFPDGFTLAAGDTVVVSVAGSDAFFDHFGFLPHLELFEDGSGADAVPDMRPVFGTAGQAGNSINGSGNPTLTDPDADSGESLVLYHWDGVSPLVTDIDIVFWGNDDRTRFSKTGVSVAGQVYQDETAVTAQQPITTSAVFGSSFQRAGADEAGQPGPPGNGIGGRDEVGEPMDQNFALETYDPARPVQEAPVILSVFTSPAFSDRDIVVRASIDAADPLASVVLFYTADGGAEQQIAASDNGDGTWDAVIPQQDAGTGIAWRLVATDIEDDQAVWPTGGGTLTFTVSEPPAPGEQAQHLLLSEVRNRGAEYIEIHNPLDAEVPLGRYYLTDAIYQFGQQFYWRITEGDPSQETVGGGEFDDFHGKFPDDAVIGAGETLTISLSGSDAFYAEYFLQPDFELFEDGDAPDDVPELVEVFDGSLAAVQEPYGNPPGLSNSAETVVLYWWDGESDLVTDVDVFFWDSEGDNESILFSKNGVTVGGSTYGPELAVSQQQPFIEEVGTGESFTRAGLAEVGENQAGFGNGVDGHDETSEDFAASFTVTTATPGQFVTEAGEGEQGEVALQVPARTFVPDLETFPVEFSTRTDTETKVRILDLEGRLVITLYDSRFDGPASVVPGVYTVRNWDGRDDTFERVRAGMYVVHLQAVDRTTGEKTVKTAPVVVATRLK